MIVSGASATAAGFVVRLGARIGFLYAAAHLFGIALFGAYTMAVAAIEIGVTIGGLGAKRILFKRLEERSDRAPAHVMLDSAVLVVGVSLLIAGLLMLGVLILGDRLGAPNLALALLWLAPAIAGQALLDLVLAGTRCDPGGALRDRRAQPDRTLRRLGRGARRSAAGLARNRASS